MGRVEAKGVGPDPNGSSKVPKGTEWPMDPWGKGNLAGRAEPPLGPPLVLHESSQKFSDQTNSRLYASAV